MKPLQKICQPSPTCSELFRAQTILGSQHFSLGGDDGPSYWHPQRPCQLNKSNKLSLQIRVVTSANSFPVARMCADLHTIPVERLDCIVVDLELGRNLSHRHCRFVLVDVVDNLELEAHFVRPLLPTLLGSSGISNHIYQAVGGEVPDLTVMVENCVRGLVVEPAGGAAVSKIFYDTFH